MAEMCKIRPFVQKVITDENGSKKEVEVESKLWNDLKEFTSDNRSLTNDLYALLRTDFVKLLGDKVQYDDNGEVILDSIKDKLNFKKVLNDSENLNRCLVKYGIANPKTNESKEYSNPIEAIGKANEFNEDCETHDAVPYLDQRGKIKFRVQPAGHGIDFIKKNLQFQSVLNSSIVQFLNQLGFQISFGDLGDSRFSGLFLPEGAKKLTDGLIDIIRVSNSQKGAEAIPEEFAHLLIEGLRHTPLVQRLLANLNSEYDPDHTAIKTILGDMFDTYDDLYKNGMDSDWEMLAKEAAGKLLAKALKGETIYDGTYDSFDDNKMKAPTTFIGRIIAFIKSIFVRVDENYVKDIILDAQQRANFISDQFVNNRQDLFQRVNLKGVQDILNSKNMAETEVQLTEFQKIVKEGHRLAMDMYYKDLNKALEGDLSRLPDYFVTEDSEKPIKNEQKAELVEALKKWREAKNNPSVSSDEIGKAYFEYSQKVYTYFNQGERFSNLKDIVEWDQRLPDPENNPVILGNLYQVLSVELQYLRDYVNDLSKELNSVSTDSDVKKMKDLAQTLVYVKKVSNAFRNFSSKVIGIKKLKEYNFGKEDVNNLFVDNGKDDKFNDYKRNIQKQFDEKIRLLSENLAGIVSGLDNEYKTLSKDMLVIMVKQYLPNNITIKKSDGTDEIITAESIVEIANSELSMADNLTKGMYQCSDYLLNILNNIFVDQQNLVRQKLIRAEQGLRALQESLEKSGHSTKCIYERDDNGHKTGRYVSNYNFELWWKQRKEYIKQIDEQIRTKELHRVMRNAMIDEWDAIHSRLVYPDDPNSLVPNLDYKENGVEVYNTHKLDALSKEEREYVDGFMLLKSKIDQYYPNKTTHLYSCVWILRDNDERKLDFLKTGNVKGAVQDWWNWKKEAFTVRDDDADYVTGQKVQIDIDGNPVRRVPIKYTCNIGKLSHMSQEVKDQLSEDASSCLLAYMAAGLNYNVCDSVINQFLVAEDYIRNVRQSPSEQGYRILRGGKKEQIKNKSVAAADRLNGWIKSVLEGNRKDLQEYRIGNYVINFGVLADRIRNFTTEYRLSFNPVTGAMNIVDETIQAAIEAFEGRFFNYKEYTAAEAKCAEMGLTHIMSTYESNPDDMLTLIQKTFDLTDDYIESLREGNIKNSTLERIYGTNFTHLFMHLGEMHNHTVPGVAHLMHIKAKLNGKEVNFFDCLEKLKYKVENGKYAYRLVLKQGTQLEIESNRFEGGKKVFDFTRKFTQKDLEDMEPENNAELDKYLNDLDFAFGYITDSIKQVNRRMNGSMATIDSGLLERHFLGRMVLQFRKWQVAYMTNRFGNSFIGSDGELHEAYWQFGLKFTWNQLKGYFYQMTNQMDKHSGFRRIEFAKLTERQKGYIKRACAEFTLFWLGILASAYLGGDWGDDDKKKKHPYDNTPFEGLGRFLYMLTIRGTLEVGASVPTLSMLDSVAKIFQDPIPSMQNIRQMIRFVNPSYIAVHINRDASEEHWGITNDYVQKLVSTSIPQIRQAWNAYDLFMTDSEKPFRWFESEN